MFLSLYVMNRRWDLGIMKLPLADACDGHPTLLALLGVHPWQSRVQREGTT